eukprot:TRINITY_DN1021_c0_g1_i2.p1 TRINITY_DN1021_c0_g1~~TRINITY_DN1021_c0_g1_i2.p1  ORF type:complete len:336 (+),score=71.36 TRINITY_DN1021_c0_g1_i2:100-1107(+)
MRWILACCTFFFDSCFASQDFTSEGAVIAVDPLTGNYTIVGKFMWPPNAIFGCAALYDPTVTFDRPSHNLYLDFGDDFGLLVTVNVEQAKVVEETSPHDLFFVGFTNMQFDPNTKRLFGMSPTGTRDGEGAFQFGSLDPSAIDGDYQNISVIPYRAMMDDTEYLASGKYWVQASYDKRHESEWCDPNNDAALCLLQVDQKSGELLSSTFTNYTVYKFADTPNANGTVLSFMFGFEGLCRHPYEDFLFANVNLTSAEATPIACIPQKVTIQEDEWISSFSQDRSMFATASGFGSELQFLSFNATTGAVLANTDLPNLAKTLGAAEGLVFIWGVDFE